MPNIFLISDTHFGHKGVCEFLCDDGITKVRPWNDPNEMDEVLVDNWNKTVGHKDKIYHLGDVAINRRCLKTLSRLNGDKVLIKGNHDIFQLKEYIPYFRDIRAYHVLDRFILSHIPVHESQKKRFVGNIHGHFHEKTLPDFWYHCVSVEQINYTPVSFDTIKEKYESCYK